MRSLYPLKFSPAKDPLVPAIECLPTGDNSSSGRNEAPRTRSSHYQLSLAASASTHADKRLECSA